MPVTGIQPRRVGAVNNDQCLLQSSAPKDLGALDSCDEHRNEGERGKVQLQQRRPARAQSTSSPIWPRIEAILLRRLLA
ncbi:hypothetical protein CO648_04835 [Rhizobium phaseoli]|nr:hypothetical protein CO648_04835 [Rhizobium phaseoli]